MKCPARPLFTRVLVLPVVALALFLALAAVLGGCSLPQTSPDTGSTSMIPSPATDTRETATTTTTEATWAPSTADRRTSSTSAILSTSTTLAEEPPVVGDAKAIAAAFKSSIVLVRAVAETDTTGYLQLEGTGVVYKTSGSDAYIITNNHVIEREDGRASRRIRVTLPSGSTVTAALVGRDPSCDLAVLHVRSRRVTPASFRTDLSLLREGDWVVAIGKPKQLKKPVVTGAIIGLYTDVEYPDPDLSGIDEVIESTAPLASGFSGGPLLDHEGRVIGINMAKFLDEPGGISLPAHLVVEVVERLLEAGA